MDLSSSTSFDSCGFQSQEEVVRIRAYSQFNWYVCSTLIRENNEKLESKRGRCWPNLNKKSFDRILGFKTLAAALPICRSSVLCPIFCYGILISGAFSVTRCWNRKWPNFTQKLPKKRPKKPCSFKVIFFIRAQEVVNIWPAFVIKLVVKIVHKCSNEVTLGAFY